MDLSRCCPVLATLNYLVECHCSAQSKLELCPLIDDFLSNTSYSAVIDFQSKKYVRLKNRIRCFVNDIFDSGICAI